MMNVLLIVINLVFAGVYLWAVEYNRYVCLALLAVAPMVDICLLGIKERLED